MKKVMLAIFLFALSVGLSAADSTHKAKNTSASNSPKMATLTGCLSGPNDEGAYMLKKGSAKHGVEVGGSSDLAQHVGHKVKLTGEWAKSGEDIGEKESMTAEKGEKGEKAERAEKAEKNEKHFKVEKIDMVSDTCTSKKATSTTAKKTK